MSQVSDYTFDSNVARNAFQSPLEAVFAAIKSSNAGGTAPSNPVAGMHWLDTSLSPPQLKIRSGDNTSWIPYLSLTTSPGSEVKIFDPTIMRRGSGNDEVRENQDLDLRYLQIADERGVYSYSDAANGYLFHKVSPTKAMGCQWMGITGSGSVLQNWPIAFSVVYRAVVSIDAPDNASSADIRFTNILSLTNADIRVKKRTFDGSASSALVTAMAWGEIAI